MVVVIGQNCQNGQILVNGVFKQPLSIIISAYLANVLVPESTEVFESLFSKLSLLYGLFGRFTAFSIHFRCSRSAIVPFFGKKQGDQNVKMPKKKMMSIHEQNYFSKGRGHKKVKFFISHYPITM